MAKIARMQDTGLIYVECPECGGWANTHCATSRESSLDVSAMQMTCDKCGERITVDVKWNVD